MKKITVLGSTGSIGKNTLEVIEHLGFFVGALAARGSNIDLLEAQTRKFQPELVAVFEEKAAALLKKRLPRLRVVSGLNGLIEAAQLSSSDIVVSALTGSIGILPTLAAIESGKDVALANKEVLVCAGSLIMKRAKEKGVHILPVDSEHSALFQCLEGREKGEVRRLILTASGGPFFRKVPKRGDSVSLKDVLKHPTWSMGAKITVDSSTLMNKGLEVIEAHFLFDIPAENIDVVIHPQSIVHSMVEFVDGSMIAQLSLPDMKLAIQYALTYPNRKQGMMPPFDFLQPHRLEFFPPDFQTFPCLKLAYRALLQGGSAPCFLSAANEMLVTQFMEEKIGWFAISDKLENLFNRHTTSYPNSVEEILAIDALAREEALT